MLLDLDLVTIYIADIHDPAMGVQLEIVGVRTRGRKGGARGMIPSKFFTSGFQKCYFQGFHQDIN